jgi:hypothetical protein
MSEVLIVDTEIQNYKPQDGFVIHPSQLIWADKLKKNAFDAVKIFNTKSHDLTQKNLFHLNRALKANGTLEVLVSQKISVLQDLDSQEIESNAKLAGFVNIETNNYERFQRIDNIDVKFQTLLVCMMKESD